MVTKGDLFDIAGVSDVSLGYGSPQILATMRSLAAHYSARALIIEPDQSGRRPLEEAPHHCTIERVSMNTNPHSSIGRIEYILKAAEVLNRERPRLLVIFCTYALPVIFKLKYRPAFILYMSIESIVAYGAYDIDMNRNAAPQLNAITFPEENRARLDAARCGFLDKPMAVLYNAVNSPDVSHILPAAERRPRILYSGALDRRRTLADYFTRAEAQRFPIDLYGAVDGDDRESLRMALMALEGRVRYHGLVDARQLASLRRQYAYSVVMWSPDNENQLYACPNKFFDAIADGVPPITAPHPQAKMLIQRYDCGICMEDWSFEAFCEAVNLALAALGSDRYAQMVENCRRAVLEELNWDVQFVRLIKLLPNML